MDWKYKLTSRKLWMAVALFISGLILAFGGEKELAETVSGCILQGAAVLGYLLAEGLTDAAGLENEEEANRKQIRRGDPSDLFQAVDKVSTA